MTECTFEDKVSAATVAMGSGGRFVILEREQPGKHHEQIVALKGDDKSSLSLFVQNHEVAASKLIRHGSVHDVTDANVSSRQGFPASGNSFNEPLALRRPAEHPKYPEEHDRAELEAAGVVNKFIAEIGKSNDGLGCRL